jgi:hypothetical protein
MERESIERTRLYCVWLKARSFVKESAQVTIVTLCQLMRYSPCRSAFAPCPRPHYFAHCCSCVQQMGDPRVWAP